MLFTEFRFLLFFVLVTTVHWLLRGNTSRKLWLLSASYTFYAAWDWRFLSLILISTLVDWVAARGMERTPARKRRWLLLSLVVNLGLLGFFKYFGFFVESATSLLAWLGFHADRAALEIILPVGISFYTFQTLSYTLDVYFGKIKTSKNLLDLALFVGFFPQLVAGPIVRARDFLPQLQVSRQWKSIHKRAAAFLFLTGYVKKACIADHLAPAVDSWFANPGNFDAAAAWTATIGYAIQIYGDFSGYSDMAIACAAFLGYQLCENFRRPYLAKNIRDFWRRWHISLSTWLRDYLYIPLGGSRGSGLATPRNLMLTMLLGGLWHGAAWTFVVWGALHGLALILYRKWDRSVSPLSTSRRILAPLAPLFTFLFVCVCWIFFRSSDFATAWTGLRAFVLLQTSGTQTLSAHWWLLFLALYLAHRLAESGKSARWIAGMPAPLAALTLGIGAALALAFTATDYRPFIYFQF